MKSADISKKSLTFKFKAVLITIAKNLEFLIYIYYFFLCLKIFFIILIYIKDYTINFCLFIIL